MFPKKLPSLFYYTKYIGMLKEKSSENFQKIQRSKGNVAKKTITYILPSDFTACWCLLASFHQGHQVWLEGKKL